MAETTVYEDRWGEIIDHPSENILEIRWFDSTAEMTSNEFNEWMSQFATEVERTGRKLSLVDALQFRMPPDRRDAGWRDANIIPRYNKAGVQRFAFLMPEQMPLIGTAPAPEEPANFPTGYFGTRRDAVAWLVEAAD